MFHSRYAASTLYKELFHNSHIFSSHFCGGFSLHIATIVSTTHKHCYNMKAQTDNAEHINDNRFSVLFLWVKNSNNKDDDALEPISIFRIVGEPGKYALYKHSCYIIVKQEQSPNPIWSNKIQNYNFHLFFGWIICGICLTKTLFVSNKRIMTSEIEFVS